MRGLARALADHCLQQHLHRLEPLPYQRQVVHALYCLLERLGSARLLQDLLLDRRLLDD
jgi:hypothetical protein